MMSHWCWAGCVSKKERGHNYVGMGSIHWQTKYRVREAKGYTLKVMDWFLNTTFTISQQFSHNAIFFSPLKFTDTKGNLNCSSFFFFRHLTTLTIFLFQEIMETLASCVKYLRCVMKLLLVFYICLFHFPFVFKN